MSEEDQELVVVLEVLYQENKEGQQWTYAFGNAYEVSKAEAVEGIKAGKYRAEQFGMGVIPEGWEEQKGGRRKAAAEVEEHNG